MPWGSSVMNYAKNGISYLGAVARPLGKRTLYGAGIGAAVGGAYGAFNPAPGSSRAGGAMAGALWGSMLGGMAGRYGGAAYRGARLNNGRMLGGLASRSGAWTSPTGRILAGAGRGAFAQLRRDGLGAIDLIGKTGLSSNVGFQKIRGLASSAGRRR